MKVYREIVLSPQPEISLNYIWEKVFQQIHLGFVEMKDSNNKVPIGIGFPEYFSEYGPLGRRLRLFAISRDILSAFNADYWLERLSDYIHLSEIRNVPANIRTFSRFKRQQPKTNVNRLARRKAKRHNISFEQAIMKLRGFKDEQVKTPFINMKSLSTDKKFRLFILKEVCDTPAYEGFSIYGLSPVSTIPEF